MRQHHRWLGMLGAAALIAAACLTGCEGGPPRPAIKIDGSSTVYKVSLAAAEEFGKTAPNVDISVKYAGTGGGFKSFAKGDLDVCDASRPITEKELALCKENGVEFYELPIAFDALTVIVNKDNDWTEQMTVEELQKLWHPDNQTTITKWSQIRAGWPDEKITLFGAGTDSGTFEYFTEAIVGEKNKSRSDYTATENDNIILQGVQGDKYALGYVPYAYFEPRADVLKAVKIDAGKGPVMPSPENVINGTYAPLSRPLFIYVQQKAAERPEVTEFVKFYVSNGKQLALAVKYIPLPDEAYPAVLQRFDSRTTGTVFDGHAAIGMNIHEILSKETK
jgi:phosphate transport system substrate-binding protein